MRKIILQNEASAQINNIVDNSSAITNNVWFWFALLACIIIGLLIFKLNRNKFKEFQTAKIDKTHLLSSINSSRGLYKQLSKVCHPDRFINTEYYGLALKIFNEISKNKRDYNKLSSLKERATKELHINF